MGLLRFIKNLFLLPETGTFNGQTLFFKNGQLYKIIGNQEDWYDPRYIVSDGAKFDLSDPMQINSIPAPNFGTEAVFSEYGATGMLDYVLRMKSGHCFDRKEKELCSALLWKSTELMFANKYSNWRESDFKRIINWHAQMNMQEETEKAKKYLYDHGFCIIIPSEYIRVDTKNTSLQERYQMYEETYIKNVIDNNACMFDGFAKSTLLHIIHNNKKFNFDLVCFNDYGSGCCGECAKLTGRVYSISGKSKKFPSLPSYVKKHGNFHAGCRCLMSPYFDTGTIFYKGKDVNAEKLSNRPFVDNRTKREKDLYDQYVNKIVENAKSEAAKEWDREEYQSLLNAQLTDVPKSFGSYRRMKNGKTTGFLKLQKKAAEIGIEI